MSTSLSRLPVQIIERRIYLIRRMKVMLDSDLADLYQVETRVLNQAVRRNRARFPDDFMFQLNKVEFDHWRSQIVISNPELKMGARNRPLAFTEQGIAMLSSVLRSERAIQVNIAIMRTFVRLREMLATHRDLARRLAALERKYDTQFQVVFEAIRKLMASPPLAGDREFGFSQKKLERKRRSG